MMKSYQPPRSPDGILEFPFEADVFDMPATDDYSSPALSRDYDLLYNEFDCNDQFKGKANYSPFGYNSYPRQSVYADNFGSEDLLEWTQQEAAGDALLGDLGFMFFDNQDALSTPSLKRKRSTNNLMKKSGVVATNLASASKTKKRKTPASKSTKAVKTTAKAVKSKKSLVETKVEKKTVKKTTKKAKDTKKTTGATKVKKTRSKTQSSKYRGVSRCSKDGRWQARIRIGSKVKYLGRFRTELEAAECYDAAAYRYHGPRAMPNFVNPSEDLARKLQEADNRLQAKFAL